jgi:hypothetical protein
LVTVKDAVVVWFKAPLSPLIVSGYVCLALVVNVFTVRVEVVAAGLGVKVTVLPEGWPVRLRVTNPLKPLIGVIVTV